MVTFHEHWMGQDQVIQVSALAQSTGYLEGEAIEIGAWQGLSTVGITTAIAPSVLHVVDHWKGDSESPAAIEQQLAIPAVCLERDNYAIFMGNMAEATEGNFKVWKMDYREFLARWDEPVRFLHLDDGHLADDVEAQLSGLLPHAVPGAIFAGDDFDWPTVREGIFRVFAEDQINLGAGKLWWVVL
jgi:Methyltransferase domain